MGVSGRKPTPRHLHVMRGTDRADRHSGEELNPGTPVDEQPPDHLGEYGREFWTWALGQWKATGVQGDRVSLEGMADLYERWRLAKAQIPKGGFFVCERTGNPKRHPAATEALQCWKELRTNAAANALNMEGWIRNKRPEGGGDDDDMFGA